MHSTWDAFMCCAWDAFTCCAWDTFTCRLVWVDISTLPTTCWRLKGSWFIFKNFNFRCSIFNFEQIVECWCFCQFIYFYFNLIFCHSLFIFLTADSQSAISCRPKADRSHQEKGQPFKLCRLCLLGLWGFCSVLCGDKEVHQCIYQSSFSTSRWLCLLIN